MKDSSGNLSAPRPALATPPERAQASALVLPAGERQPYSKPVVKRLGRLCSVTGSNLVW